MSSKPPISFFATPRGKTEPRYPITCRRDFDEAMASFSTDADIWHEAYEAQWNTWKYGSVSRHDDWESVCRLIRRGLENEYMEGSCWHAASAMHRLFGLPLVAIIVPGGEGDPDDPDPGKRPDGVEHVAAILPDGRFVDMRGPLRGESELCRNMSDEEHGDAKISPYVVRAITDAEIQDIVRDYDRITAPVDRELFLEKTDIIVRTLFDDLISGEFARRSWKTDRSSSFSVWHLGDPSAPVKIGTASLVDGGRRCAFSYDDDWLRGGFPLSPDMPLVEGLQVPSGKVGGALADAVPDRWGQYAIRMVDRPVRVCPLDVLYLAGDRRVGALGISSDPDSYRPHAFNALWSAEEGLRKADRAIQRLLLGETMTEREFEFLRTSRGLGGSKQKILVEFEGVEWIAKLPQDGPVDLGLVEHATAKLAESVGIRVPETQVVWVESGTAFLSKRFDRDGSKRVHVLSGKTMLLDTDESYVALAGVIRRYGNPETVAEQCRELFVRMAFNMLIGNSDDHGKNHAFIRLPSGHYELSPAYDILPQLGGLRRQAIPIYPGCQRDDFEAAIGCASDFGMTADQAMATWREVADGVDRWREVFAAVGVTDGDIDCLADFLDGDDRAAMRRSLLSASHGHT